MKKQQKIKAKNKDKTNKSIVTCIVADYDIDGLKGYVSLLCLLFLFPVHEICHQCPIMTIRGVEEILFLVKLGINQVI